MLPICKLDPQATLPTRAHADDAGLDLYLLEDTTLPPGLGQACRTGIALEIPSKHVGIVADRSSMGLKGIKTMGGVIDSNYRGELKVILWNLGPEPRPLKAGERIAQLLIYPIATPLPYEVQTLSNTDRGGKGFGSTGQ